MMVSNGRILITKNGHEHGNTGQSGGLKFMTGVGPQHTPATKIWFGKASNPPSFRSLPACRSPENIIVNLPDVEDFTLVGYRRV